MDCEYRSQLEKLQPNATLSVELPCSGTGNNYQVRTTISGGVVFYGRADTEDEAVSRCCKKAVAYILKHQVGAGGATSAPSASSAVESVSKWRPLNSSTPASSSAASSKRSSLQHHQGRYDQQPRSSGGLNKREVELRDELADVLDRVASWSRSHDPGFMGNNNRRSDAHNSEDFLPSRRSRGGRDRRQQDLRREVIQQSENARASPRSVSPTVSTSTISTTNSQVSSLY